MRSNRHKIQNSSGLECKLCKQNQVFPKAKLYYTGVLVDVFSGRIKAENYAFENHMHPAIIEIVYKCDRCGHEELKGEHVFEYYSFLRGSSI